MISPLGSTTQANWSSVMANGCAIRKLDSEEFADIDCKIGGKLTTEMFDPADYPTSFGYRINSLAAALAK